MLIMAFDFGFLSQLIFTVKSVEQDVLCITVFDRDLFSPNGKCYSPYPNLLGALLPDTVCDSPSQEK